MCPLECLNAPLMPARVCVVLVGEGLGGSHSGGITVPTCREDVRDEECRRLDKWWGEDFVRSRPLPMIHLPPCFQRHAPSTPRHNMHGKEIFPLIPPPPFRPHPTLYQGHLHGLSFPGMAPPRDPSSASPPPPSPHLRYGHTQCLDQCLRVLQDRAELADDAAGDHVVQEHCYDLSAGGGRNRYCAVLLGRSDDNIHTSDPHCQKYQNISSA